jgi:hypothetical protein
VCLIFAALKVSTGGFLQVFGRLKSMIKAKTRAIDVRRMLVVTLLLAFVIQGQLAASHFHLLSASAATSIGDGKQNAPAPDHKKSPLESDCPICQQLASAHNLLLHNAIALSLPDLIDAQPLDVFDERAPVAIIALNWQSRAPPL